MREQLQQDMIDFFRASCIGGWKLEMENGEAVRLFVDENMRLLIGAPEGMSPEACCAFFTAHIYPDDLHLMSVYGENMMDGDAEIIYRYCHPTRGELQVRCCGRKMKSSGSLVTIVGYHKVLADVIRLGGEASTENELLRENRNLKCAQTQTTDYYKSLLDMETCGVLAYTVPDHRVLHMNAEALRVFGLHSTQEAQDKLGMLMRSIVYQDAATLDRLRNLRKERDSVDYECSIRSLSGGNTNVLARTEAFVTPWGERSVVTTFMDVSENRMLRKEKGILEALCVDYTSVYLLDLDADTMTPVKPSTGENQARELMGDKSRCYSYRMRFHKEHMVLAASAPDYEEKMSPEYLRSYLSRHDRFLYRFQTVPNHSGYQHFEVQAVKLNVNTGFQAVMGFRYVDDIVREEERKNRLLQEALREARRKNEIIGAIRKVYWQIYSLNFSKKRYFDADNLSTLENPGDSLAGGIDAGSFRESVERLVAPEFRTAMEEFLDPDTLVQRLKDRDSISCDYRATDGMWLTARYIVQRRGADGKVKWALLAIQSITEQKQQELEYQQRLRAAAEEASRANIAKTDFLRRMSHDIRTPINGIMGMLTIGDHYRDDLEKQRDCREHIREATGYLLELVNNILDMNKLESGTVKLEHKPFDLTKMLVQLDTIVALQTQERGLDFRVEKCEIRHPHLLGSPLHLRQLLQNITDNAVKYNRPGGSIRVGCEEIAWDGKRVTFRIYCQDTGIGMSREFQKHAFEPFAQEANSARSTYQGTGLGLAIADQLVKLMGGSLKLESEQGVGSKFTLEQSFDVDFAYAEPEVRELPRAEHPLENARILLVEDNELNMDIARFLLEKEGAVVVPAWNGREAVETFGVSDPGAFDLILMDIMMPVMDGLDAARAIRRLPREDAAAVPIFAMTANAFQDDVQRSLEAGMNAHLSKPINVAELLSTAAQFVKKK